MKSISSTLESKERETKKLLAKSQPEASKGDGCTLLTAWTRRPATVVIVQERRMLVQEDEVMPDGTFRVDPRGVLHGFRRRLNSQKWKYASDWRINGQRTLGVIIGERILEEPDFSADPD